MDLHYSTTNSPAVRLWIAGLLSSQYAPQIPSPTISTTTTTMPIHLRNHLSLPARSGLHNNNTDKHNHQHPHIINKSPFLRIPLRRTLPRSPIPIKRMSRPLRHHLFLQDAHAQRVYAGRGYVAVHAGVLSGKYGG